MFKKLMTLTSFDTYFDWSLCFLGEIEASTLCLFFFLNWFNFKRKTSFNFFLFFSRKNYNLFLGAPPLWNGLKMAVELSPVCPQNLPSLNNSQQHLTTGRYNHLKRLMRYLQNESEGLHTFFVLIHFGFKFKYNVFFIYIHFLLDCLFLNLYVPEWCKYYYI